MNIRVHTYMGKQVGSGGKRPEEGTKISVRLAVRDIGNVTGKYWANGSVRDAGDGEVREW